MNQSANSAIYQLTHDFIQSGTDPALQLVHVYGYPARDTFKILKLCKKYKVYLIEDIKTKEQNVMKILHPNVKNQINFFEKFMKFILFFPCIKKKFKQVFPFNLFEFISQFKQL